MKYLFEDSDNSFQSINNLDLLIEEEEVLSAKVQRWAQESANTAKFSLKQKLGQIIVRIKSLFGIRTFGGGKGNVKILEDISGFNRLIRFIQSTTTYKVAHFGPNNVVSYSGNINLVNTYLINKGNIHAKKLHALYETMKGEMNSKEAKLARHAASNTKSIRVTNEKTFRIYIVPFIRNMLIATKKLNVMITKMYKSFENLVSHYSTIMRKNKMDRSSTTTYHQKNDLTARCITYVAYANKLLITTCENLLDKINRIIEHYYNAFAENN